MSCINILTWCCGGSRKGKSEATKKEEKKSGLLDGPNPTKEQVDSTYFKAERSAQTSVGNAQQFEQPQQSSTQPAASDAMQMSKTEDKECETTLKLQKEERQKETTNKLAKGLKTPKTSEYIKELFYGIFKYLLAIMSKKGITEERRIIDENIASINKLSDLNLNYVEILLQFNGIGTPSEEMKKFLDESDEIKRHVLVKLKIENQESYSRLIAYFKLNRIQLPPEDLLDTASQQLGDNLSSQSQETQHNNDTNPDIIGSSLSEKEEEENPISQKSPIIDAELQKIDEFLDKKRQDSQVYTTLTGKVNEEQGRKQQLDQPGTTPSISLPPQKQAIGPKLSLEDLTTSNISTKNLPPSSNEERIPLQEDIEKQVYQSQDDSGPQSEDKSTISPQEVSETEEEAQKENENLENPKESQVIKNNNVIVEPTDEEGYGYKTPDDFQDSITDKENVTMSNQNNGSTQEELEIPPMMTMQPENLENVENFKDTNEEQGIISPLNPRLNPGSRQSGELFTQEHNNADVEGNDVTNERHTSQFQSTPTLTQSQETQHNNDTNPDIIESGLSEKEEEKSPIDQAEHNLPTLKQPSDSKPISENFATDNISKSLPPASNEKFVPVQENIEKNVYQSLDNFEPQSEEHSSISPEASNVEEDVQKENENLENPEKSQVAKKNKLIFEPKDEEYSYKTPDDFQNSITDKDNLSVSSHNNDSTQEEIVIPPMMTMQPENLENVENSPDTDKEQKSLTLLNPELAPGSRQSGELFTQEHIKADNQDINTTSDKIIEEENSESRHISLVQSAPSLSSLAQPQSISVNHPHTAKTHDFNTNVSSPSRIKKPKKISDEVYNILRGHQELYHEIMKKIITNIQNEVVRGATSSDFSLKDFADIKNKVKDKFNNLLVNIRTAKVEINKTSQGEEFSVESNSNNIVNEIVKLFKVSESSIQKQQIPKDEVETLLKVVSSLVKQIRQMYTDEGSFIITKINNNVDSSEDKSIKTNTEDKSTEDKSIKRESIQNILNIFQSNQSEELSLDTVLRDSADQLANILKAPFGKIPFFIECFKFRFIKDSQFRENIKSEFAESSSVQI